METLGSLCDKLIIVKLKMYHTSIENRAKQESLSCQDLQLREEINEYVNKAISGTLRIDRMVYEPNKVHDGTVNVAIPIVSIAGTISVLATVNCDIWHQQEKIYNFAKLPAEQKDEAIHQIAVLNLQRNDCIHQIDKLFKEMVV